VSEKAYYRAIKEMLLVDKIDAKKLVMLLKAGLLKEVYHTGSKFIELRKIVSGYEDTIKSGVRLKVNHRTGRLYQAVFSDFIFKYSTGVKISFFKWIA
jgi:hypothetical protein